MRVSHTLDASLECCDSDIATPGVIPVLVTGIQPPARSGACFALGPGNKCRDDKNEALETGH